MMNKELKAHVTSSDHWLRFLFMILFAVILYVASAVVFVVVLLQFVFALLTGNDNPNLRRFGASLSSYIFQCLQFLTYASDDKPFPLADWPEGECLVRKSDDVTETVDQEEQAHSTQEDDGVETKK